LGIQDSTIIKPIKNTFNGNLMNYNSSTGELCHYSNINFLIQNETAPLTNNTNAQNAFTSPYSSFNAQVGTYEVEWLWSCSSLSAVSRTLRVLWAGTAGFNLVRMYYSGEANPALQTVATDTNSYQTGTGAVSVASASTEATNRFFGKGIIRITSAGTITPQVLFLTAGPGASAVRTTGSYIYFKYLNTNNANSYGDWV
jgi:hypothetical protein